MKFVMRVLLFLSVLIAGTPSWAAIPGQMNEDIDIFLLNAAIPAQRPNVLIIWDNTANWGQTMGASTAYDLEKAALSTVISNLKTGDNGEPLYNVGLMLFTETGGGNSNARGSYVRYHIRPMTGDIKDPVTGAVITKGNKTMLAELISSLHTINDRGSNAQYAKAMHEAYLYFGGNTALAGSGQMKRDCEAFADAPSGNPDPKNANQVCKADLQNYTSPIGDGCQKNYIIFISNGTTDNGENNEAQGLLTALPANKGVTPALIGLNPAGEQANWADEYARYMAKNAIHPDPKFKESRAKTFAIAVYDAANCVSPFTKNSNACNQRALARSQSVTHGDGEYFDGTNLDQIKIALEQTFARIQEVDGAFASTTLPVSVNVRGTHVNQLYMGVFRPDAGLKPRWDGNLKMYQLAADFGTNPPTVFLADANGNAAEDTTNGFIKSGARSHWTITETPGFWAFLPEVATEPTVAFDNPDGPTVEKGATAQGLRTAYKTSQAGRTVYTCLGTCGTLSNFEDSNSAITAAMLGVAAAADPVAERTKLIDWVRGQNNAGNEPSNGVGTDVRPSIHGDVLHSRPAVVNYNRNTPADDNDVVAFYGANDAIFRAVKGGVTGASAAGTELWGFIAPEFFDRLNRLRNNSPVMDPGANRRQYFMDGSIGVYRKDANNDGKIDPAIDPNDKVHLFVGMRRGGRFLYAIDVTNPNSPVLLWKKSNTDFPELGQTWSEPKVATINLAGTPTVVLIMGAGYDSTVQDNENALPGTDTMGRGIMILDAATGNMIWQAGHPEHLPTVQVPEMTNSIPSDVTILDRNGDGFIDRLYVGDTGGNLWRVDIADPDLNNWVVNKLATIGGTDPVDRRKFLYPPDVVFNPGVTPGFDSVLIGTGDREHPFETIVANRYYMFKDFGTGNAFVPPMITASTLANADAADLAAQLKETTNQGWSLNMLQGEKVVSGSITLGGVTFFNTNTPVSVATNACTTNLGEARQYALSFENASAVIDYDGTPGFDRSSQPYGKGGFLPSPVPVVVQIENPATGEKTTFNVVVAGTKITMPPQTALEHRYRTYWYMKTD